MGKALKDKTIYGMFWNTLERFGSSLFLFLTNLILSRMLSPSDFGCIGMLLVFVSLSEAIVDGGFGSALIHKKNPSQKDYSTIFYWNILLAFLLYLVLYFSSSIIADFYHVELLTDILKVQGVILIINAFSLIQKNILVKQISFKRVAKINLFGVFVGSIVGIVFAYLGFGVWSLVIKSLSTAVLQCITYWVINRWRPYWIFSWDSFVELFQYGSFLFLTVVFNALYHNVLSLVIGRSFSPSALGYFTQAKKMEDIPRSSISSVVTSVSFPVFSEMKDDKNRLRNAVQSCLKSVMFINLPIMLILIVVAKPLILLLFTEKWEQSIPCFQALCVYGIFYTPNELNRGVTKAIGKSKITLLILMLQRTLGLSLVFSGLYWGMKGLLVGYVFSEILCYIISAAVTGKFIQYGIWQQLKSFIPIFCISLLAAFLSYLLIYLPLNLGYSLLIFLHVITFCISYISFALIFRIQGIEPYIYMLKTKFSNK